MHPHMAGSSCASQKKTLRFDAMPSASILLRLFLCALLALNGISNAAAAGRMATAHAEHAVTTLQDHPGGAGDEAMPPCHGDVAEAMPTTPVEQSAPLGDLEPCCDLSACQCACVHHYAATIVVGVLTAPLLPGSDITRSLDVSHRAPALPHLIRPPIS